MKLVNTQEQQQPPSMSGASPSLTRVTTQAAGNLPLGVWSALVLAFSLLAFGCWHFYNMSELQWGFAHQAGIGKVDPAGNRYWAESITGAPGTKVISGGERR